MKGCLLVFFLLLQFLTIKTEAQEIKIKKNCISINQARSNLYDKNLKSYYQRSLWNLTTFSYERLLTSKFSLSAAYGTWLFFRSRPVHGYISYSVPDLTIYPGSYLWERYNYSFADLLAGYKIYNYKHFYFKGYIGASATWGTKTYLDYVLINPEPPEDVLFYTSEKKAIDLGMIVSLNCSYNFWKQRIKVGVFGTGRHYPGLHSTQLDLGFQVGYNF